jgi:hypothetical protein
VGFAARLCELARMETSIRVARIVSRRPPFASPLRLSRAQSRRMRAGAPLQSQRS